MYIHINSLHKRKIGGLEEKERAIGSPQSDETSEQTALDI
jgi:hypothetical protein